jgi:hypothetical protein
MVEQVATEQEVLVPMPAVTSISARQKAGLQRRHRAAQPRWSARGSVEVRSNVWPQ